jgi:cob(I)alamin adenosyltransferase
MLARIQNDLFDLGADLCVPDTGKDLGYEPLRILPGQAERLEKEIDRLNGELAPLRSFVLPGGHPAAAHLHLADHARLDAMLGLIQNDLFDLGADLTVPEREGKAERLRVLPVQVERLERDIDALNEALAPLTSFILPGGTAAAAHLHQARTICRRAERLVVELAGKDNEPVGDAVVRYLNRLSDFLFVASRAANGNGAGDVLWVPGQNR